MTPPSNVGQRDKYACCGLTDPSAVTNLSDAGAVTNLAAKPTRHPAKHSIQPQNQECRSTKQAKIVTALPKRLMAFLVLRTALPKRLMSLLVLRTGLLVRLTGLPMRHTSLLGRAIESSRRDMKAAQSTEDAKRITPEMIRPSYSLQNCPVRTRLHHRMG